MEGGNFFNQEQSVINKSTNVNRGRSQTININKNPKGISQGGIEYIQVPHSGYDTGAKLYGDNSSNNPIKSAISDLRIDKTFLLCVDPEDKNTFQINMATGTINDKLTVDCKKLLQCKIDRQHFILKELLDDLWEKQEERKTPWKINESPSSESYRRSMI